MKPPAIALGLGLAFSLGLLASGLSPELVSESEAQSKSGAARGAGHAGVAIEDFKFRTAKGGRATVRSQRDVIVVPTSYGSLTHITTQRDRSVLWYQDSTGALRNVYLETGIELVKITRQ